MSWSYSGNPQDSEKDAIRFTIGDTDEEWQLIQDEEINYSLSVEPNWVAAAANCCEAISRKFAREADFKLGPQSVNASQRAEAYATIAHELRRKSSVGMYVGGISPYEEQLDRHLRQPAFKRGLMDNRGAGSDG